MSKAVKIWLIVAASLVILGIIMFGVLMNMLNWNFLKLGTVQYETNSYEIGESFSNISINADTAVITVLPSEDGKVKVELYEHNKEKYSVTVENDTLTINILNNRKWYDYIGITAGSPKMTIYLPAREYGSLVINESTGAVEIQSGFHFGSVDIEASTGNIKIGGMSTGDMNLSVTTGYIDASNIIGEDLNIEVSTGKTKLTSVKCRNLISEGDTGSISLTDVVAREKFDIERSTGDVRFDGCDAKDIYVETDTGDVKGSLLSEKIFMPRTDTGRINVPKTTSGGVCEITTDTGDIIINIK